MNGSYLYDSLQIAYEFMERAEQLVANNEYDTAQSALEKAKSYAFNNEALLDDLQSRSDFLNKARGRYIKQLETETADLFNRERFDSQEARQILQALLQHNGQSDLGKSLWAELPARETAERERRLVEDFQDELDNIWQRAQELEEIGAGSRAVAEYERAVTEAAKKAGDFPAVILLQRLKLAAIEKRDRAKDKWVGTPTLILARKGQDLVDRYKTLKQQGEIETEFFDENGEFLGRLPVDDCIDRAKKLASRFAEQKAQDYLGQARDLLDESPGAAYDKIQDALSLAYPSDFAKSILEQELQEKIQPAMQRREKALAQLKAALSKEDPVEAWHTMREAEQIDRFTPGLEDARQRLLPMLHQRFTRLIETGHRLQELEDFEAARLRFQDAINIGQIVFAYGEEFQDLHSSAQADFERCVQAEQAGQQFDQLLAGISQQSQTEPERAKQQLAELSTRELSAQAVAKIERLRVQIDFKLGVDQLFHSLEQKMRASTDATELIPIEEGARSAGLDYPDEERFGRLTERISARRFFLKGSRLREDPEHYLEAREFLQQVIDFRGDDAAAAQTLLDEIELDEQQETDIAIAIQEAAGALDNDDVRSAFLLLEPYRHVVSRQMPQLRQLMGTAVTRWRSDIDRQLEELVAAGHFCLPKVEWLLQELERSRSPRLNEWQVRALAPTYAHTARDLQELNHWDRAGDLWEQAFRLAPNDPSILEGRRNAQKHRALIQAQLTSDPVEKEQLLNDINQIYADDPTIKRYLAEFYYAEDRYVEARLAVSQALFLSEQMPPVAPAADIKAIRHIESLIQAAEKTEKRKLVIRSQITGNTTISDLREARRAYEQLSQATPDQAEKLESWWTELIKETENHMKAQVSNLSDAARTVWARVELLSKILALQANPDIQAQAERMLKLIYHQLPAEVKSVVDNPEGISYGPAAQALSNHATRAKDLYKKLINLSQVERVAPDLGLDLGRHTLDLNNILYELELTLEKLHYALEKRREIKNQIVVALMTGTWESVEDGLQELEMKALGQHRGLKDLWEETEQARHKRVDLEKVVEQIKEAMEQEAFPAIQDRLKYMLAEDPADETQLQSTLVVVDPHTGLKIRGHRELGTAIAEKSTVFDTLRQWHASCPPPVDWAQVRAKMVNLADSGEFTPAIKLGRAITGANDDHQELLREDTWSLGHVCRYFGTSPVPQEQINSRRVQALFDEINQKADTLKTQIDECNELTEQLQRQEAEFTQIIDELRSSLKRLNQPRDFLSSILPPSPETKNIKLKIINLIEQGRRLCPTCPAFANFEKSQLMRR